MAGVESIGTCLSHEWKGGVLQIGTWGYDLQVSFVDEGICRIRARHCGNKNQDHSYVTEGKRTPIQASFAEAKHHFELKTGALRLLIKKDPVRFTLFNNRGEVLLEDDPDFGLTAVGTEVATYRKLQPNERFLGLGDTGGPLDKRGHAYSSCGRSQADDVSEADGSALSVPFFMGVHKEGAYGVLLDNSHASAFNFGASSDRFSWFSCEDGEMDQYLIGGRDVAEVICLYTSLTGRMSLPPKWSLGYQSCHAVADSDIDIENLFQAYKKKDMSVDVLCLDIHCGEEGRAFAFNQRQYTNAAQGIAELQKQGCRVVCTLGPGIKTDEDSEALGRGRSKDVFVKMSDGTPHLELDGETRLHFPDFTAQNAREWWSSELKFYHKLGVNGLALSMNESSKWGATMPPLLIFDYDGNSAALREARLIYGLQMARCTAEGMQQHMGEERSLTLTTSAFSGIQRYAGVIIAGGLPSENRLLKSVSRLQSMGLSGLSYAGVDMGSSVTDFSPESFARWMSLGVFQPLFRGHIQPWSYGKEIAQICRDYIKLRHALMPYVYSSIRQSCEHGMPLMRSLAIAYTHDELVYSAEYQAEYMFGSALLVIPCEGDKQQSKAYLPEGRWYDMYTDQCYGSGEIVVESPLHKLPVFVKAGEVLMMQEGAAHLGHAHDGVLRAHVYLGGESESHFFEDDGETQHSTSAMRVIHVTQTSLTVGEQTGVFQSAFSTIRVYFHGLKAESLQVNAKSHSLRTEDLYCLQSQGAEEEGDAVEGKKEVIRALPFVELRYDKSPINIEWSEPSD